MKKYVIFTAYELTSMMDGGEVSSVNDHGETVTYISKQAYDEKFAEVTKEHWAKAIDYLRFLISEYASLQGPGDLALKLTLIPLKKRYDKGERTRELYDEIMECS